MPSFLFFAGAARSVANLAGFGVKGSVLRNSVILEKSITKANLLFPVIIITGNSGIAGVRRNLSPLNTLNAKLRAFYRSSIKLRDSMAITCRRHSVRCPLSSYAGVRIVTNSSATLG